MSDISIILFQKDDRKIPDNIQIIIDKTINNFKKTCANSIEIVNDSDGNNLIVNKNVRDRGSVWSSTPPILTHQSNH